MASLTEKPLRILAIVNLPWEPRLGAARVYIELAKQWKAAGHHVERFCLTDAFPKATAARKLSMLRPVFFPRRAARYLRDNASRFDVIDALIGTVPFSKKRLRFDGLLVARSVGLPRAYHRFNRVSREYWPDQPRGKFIGRLLYTFTYWLWRRETEDALRRCDLINVLNKDEIQSLQDPPAISTPFIVQPNGLSDSERTALASAMEAPEIRLQRKEICFVGMWGLRKGSRDWPKIVRAILNAVPNARFAFLGTMTDEQTVLRDLGLSSRDSIRCVTSYDPADLPRLIGGSMVGLFPSYIEGFGLAVLEQLASGIPTIAYDVPGPRHIFGANGARFLVPTGDTGAMVDRTLEIVRMNETDYSALSAKCRQIAAHFRWEQIASDTIGQYVAALARQNSGNAPREG